MLGSRAGVAATFGGIGFHERGLRRQVEEVVRVEKQISEKKEMGKIRDPLADGGQGKMCCSVWGIHDRARRKRLQKSDGASSQRGSIPALEPQYETPDKRPAPAFHPIQMPVTKPVQVPTELASEIGTVQMPQKQAPQPVQVPTVQVPQKQAPAAAKVQVPTKLTAPMTVQVPPALVQVQQQPASTGVEEYFVGLKPPTLESGARINGANKRQLRRENKQRRIRKQEEQEESSYWSQ
jgi:hypothetical protein